MSNPELQTKLPDYIVHNDLPHEHQPPIQEWNSSLARILGIADAINNPAVLGVPHLPDTLAVEVSPGTYFVEAQQQSSNAYEFLDIPVHQARYISGAVLQGRELRTLVTNELGTTSNLLAIYNSKHLDPSIRHDPTIEPDSQYIGINLTPKQIGDSIVAAFLPKEFIYNGEKIGYDELYRVEPEHIGLVQPIFSATVGYIDSQTGKFASLQIIPGSKNVSKIRRDPTTKEHQNLPKTPFRGAENLILLPALSFSVVPALSLDGQEPKINIIDHNVYDPDKNLAHAIHLIQRHAKVYFLNKVSQHVVYQGPLMQEHKPNTLAHRRN